MMLDRCRLIGLSVALALLAFTGFPAEIAAAGNVNNTEEFTGAFLSTQTITTS